MSRNENARWTKGTEKKDDRRRDERRGNVMKEGGLTRGGSRGRKDRWHIRLMQIRSLCYNHFSMCNYARARTNTHTRRGTQSACCKSSLPMLIKPVRNSAEGMRCFTCRLFRVMNVRQMVFR